MALPSIHIRWYIVRTLEPNGPTLFLAHIATMRHHHLSSQYGAIAHRMTCHKRYKNHYTFATPPTGAYTAQYSNILSGIFLFFSVCLWTVARRAPFTPDCFEQILIRRMHRRNKSFLFFRDCIEGIAIVWNKRYCTIHARARDRIHFESIAFN